MADLFVNCGDKNGFSGVAVYTIPNLNCIVRADRYKDGKKIQGVFLLDKRLPIERKINIARDILNGITAKGKKIPQTRAFGETDWWEDDFWNNDDDDDNLTYTDKDGNTCNMKDFDGTLYPYVKEEEEDDDEDDNGNEAWMDETRPGGIDWEDPNWGDIEEDRDDGFNDEPNEEQESSSKEYSNNDTDLKAILDTLRPILKKLGIDIDKYKIRRPQEGSMCAVNARVLSDNTIELCQRFFEFKSSEQASILWHEIYHIEHNHHASGNPNGIIIELPTPPNDILQGINTYIEWLYANLADDYAVEDMKRGELEDYLNIGRASDIQWYENEIETYTEELNNGLSKSDYYEGLINFNLWKFNEIIDIINKQKQGTKYETITIFYRPPIPPLWDVSNKGNNKL